MFSMRMRPEPIPERVFALGEVLTIGSHTKSDLKNKLEPAWLNFKEGASYYSHTFELAKELGLICEHNNLVSLAVSAEIFYSFSAFRRFCAKRAFAERDSMFFRYSQWYLDQNEKHYGRRNADEMIAALGPLFPGINDNDLRGWRFWASFLGIGILHDMFLIPNMYVRLDDALLMDQQIDKLLEQGKSMIFGDFYSWLRVTCPESISESGQELCLGLSQGLRMLHDQQRIVLENRPDAREKWRLYRMDTHVLSGQISHITINM